MMHAEPSKEVENSKHKRKSLDGKQLESTSTFPPFKSILLEEEDRQFRAVPLARARDEPHMTNIEKKNQGVSGQVN